MKFVTFLKIFAIALASFVGAIGLGIGVMAIAGTFSEPNIQPQEISFEFSEYKVDNDFTVKITTTTEGVTKDEITLSLPESSNVTERNGRIFDDVISIPKKVKIGEEFTVTLIKKINDLECNGLEWIAGGHSVIKATSVNPSCESVKAKVHVDVPVHSIEVLTKVNEADQDSNLFVLNTSFNAYIKFYPARSAYQFSFDGQNNTQLIHKNAYFMLGSSSDEYISQVDNTNQFTADKIGNDSSIVGYVFSSTIIEENSIKQFESQDDTTRYNSILRLLEEKATTTQVENKEAKKATKTVSVIDIDVDDMTATGKVNDVYVNDLHTIYTNKSSLLNKESSLDIRLISNNDATVSLQGKLNNVGITFLYKQGNTYHNAVNNVNESFNIVQVPQNAYSSSTVVIGDNDEEYTYFFPVLTSSVDNYYWQFAINQYIDNENAVCVRIKYFGNDEIQTIDKTFSVNTVVSNLISWNNLDNVDLYIFDGEQVDYQEVDIKERAQVPQTNLYQTKKYFIYSQTSEDVSAYLYTGSAVDYTLGVQTYTLYELEEGVLKAKSKSAHGKTFNVIFLTVETDYNGNIKLDADNKYIVDEYSKDNLGALSSIAVSVFKTLNQLSSNIITSAPNEELIIFQEQEGGVDNLSFIHNSVSPFEVVVSYNLPEGASAEEIQAEEQIFRQAIQDEKVKVIAKINDVETDIISTLSVSESSSETLSYKFSMTIKELPVSLSEVKVYLFVSYDMVEGKTSTSPVTTYNENTALGYIEVYNGEAKTFAFNLNICNENAYATSEENRILVSSDIEQQNGYINSITTSYLLNDENIENHLFVEEENVPNTSKINIVLLDKHGRLPLSSTYTLESSNQAVMVRVGDSVTFVGIGEADLILKDANGNIRDTLYFKSEKSGNVTKVNKLVETISDYVANKEEVNEFSYIQDAYSFSQITMSIVGYAGSTIWLNTTDANLINLLTYEYTYTVEEGETETGKLTAKTKFELINEEDQTLLEDYVLFDLDSPNASKITIQKDFGERKSIQFLVTVPELGISQVLVLDIKPNISISVIPKNNPVAEPEIGNPTYNGVYSDSIYKAEVQIQYTVISSVQNDAIIDNSEYFFYVYDVDATEENQGRKIVGISAEGEKYAYVAKVVDLTTGLEVTKSQAIKKESLVSLYRYEYYFVFVSQNEGTGFKKLILSLEKNEDSTSVDIKKTLYLNINPNIQVNVLTSDVYLTTKFENKTNLVYGEAVIFDLTGQYAITISRIIDNSSEIDENIALLNSNLVTLELISADGFVISDFTLQSISHIDNSKTVTIEVLYNGVSIGQRSNGTKQYVDLNVYPNIRYNLESNCWVKYNGEYYLKLIASKEYTFEELLNAFTYSEDFSSIIKFTENDYLTINETSIEVSGRSDVFIINEDLNGKIILSNASQNETGERFGDSVSFKAIILPSDLPLIIYKDASGNDIDLSEEDLANLLSVEFLAQNLDKYSYKLVNAGNSEGTQITFTITDGVLSENAVGIQHFEGATYSVQNVDPDDKNVYAYFDSTNKVLRTEAIGKDVYVVLYSRLSLSSDSLIIPYLIKIQKELEIQTYYPFADGASNNTEITNVELIAENASYDMEYVSFDENNQAKVDMLELFDINTPNYANKKRFAIGKYVLEGEDEIFTEMALTGLSATVNFNVEELYYYYYGWKKADNISNYAQFTSNINGNGLLVINRKDAEKIRLRVEITTTSGVVGWYYLSVGEIPIMQLSEKNNQDVFTQNISDITINASEDYDLSTNKYKLYVESQNADRSDLLRFYSPAQLTEQLTIENNAIKTESATSDWNTNLIFYTKYGQLANVKVLVLSNYKLNAKDSEVVQYNENEKLFEVVSGNLINIEEIFEIIKNETDTFEIDCTEIQFLNNTAISQVYVNGSTIVVGAVNAEHILDVYIGLTFTDEQEVEYEHTFKLKVLPYLGVNKYNDETLSNINMLPLTDISAGTNEEYDILSDLFTTQSQNSEITLSNWVHKVLTNNIGKFESTLISQNVLGSFSASVVNVGDDAVPNYQVNITVSEVALESRISFKLSYYNIAENGEAIELFKSYFSFVVTPNFTIKVNYPKPNNEAVVSGETIQFVEDEEFSLQDANILADNKRIQVLDLTGVESEVYKAKIYISTTSTHVVTRDESSLAGQYVLLSNAVFKFENITDAYTSIQFGIYYQIEANKYISIGNYNLVISKSSVYRIDGYNFNTLNNINSIANPEFIYIGEDDNVMNKFKVEFTIPQTVVLDTTKYLQILSVGGCAVESQEVALPLSSQGQIMQTWVILTNAGQTFNNNVVDYKIYEKDENGNEVVSNLTDNQGNNVEIKFSLKARIEIFYTTVVDILGATDVQQIEFFKQYSILNIQEINVDESKVSEESNAEVSLEQPIKLIDSDVVLGTYYIDYKFDIEFETYNVELSTGQSTTLTKDLDLASDKNYLNSFNMKRISNGTYYKESDFASNGLYLFIDTALIDTQPTDLKTTDPLYSSFKKNLGYLRITHIESTIDEGTIYDYIFLAMGSPKETRVTVSLKLTVNYGNIKKDYSLTFTVSNDYIEPYLRNNNNTTNSQGNRNYLYASSNYVTFAYAGSENQLENFIYITHKNEITGGNNGNVAPFFTITYNQGEQYIQKLTQSSSQLDLKFKLTDVEFGNVNVDIVFTDAYGYTFTYYLTIVAKYNPVCKEENIIIYEQDEIQFVNSGTGSADVDVNIPITIEQRDEALESIRLTDIQAENITLKFIPDNKDLINNEAIQNIISQHPNSEYKLTIGYLDSSLFTNSVITGTLQLTITRSGRTSSPIEIPLTIKERYSIETSDTPYVRDGVAFSLLDIIDVVDNKSQVAVASRTLKNVNTVYLNYTLTGTNISEDEENPLEKIGDLITLGIEAYNTNNGQTIRQSLENTRKGSYTPLEDLFDLQSIDGWQFKLFYWDSTKELVTVNYFKTLASNDYYIYNENLEDAYKESSISVNVIFGENTYTLTILQCYSVVDQTFTIGLRKLENNQNIMVNFYEPKSQSIRGLNVLADSNTVKTYSLREQRIISNGETVELYTSSDKSIVNGLENGRCATLKGIKFEGDELSDDYKLTKYIEDKVVGETFKISNDGNNIKYQESNLKVNVKYAISQDIAYKEIEEFEAPIWITLKYIDVETTLAYLPDNTLRKVDITDSNRTITIDKWAGTTSREFTLISGYTTATTFTYNESKALSANVQDGQGQYRFEFSINTAQSSGDTNYVSINKDTGTLELGDLYDITYNYIAIDIKVKYGSDTSNCQNPQLIDTVKVAFRNPSVETVNISAKAKKLPYIRIDNSYIAKQSDVLDMLLVTDGADGAWSGLSLLELFSTVKAQFYATTRPTDDSNSITLVYNNATIEIPVDDQLKTNLVVSIGENDKVITDIQLVESCYIDNGLVSAEKINCDGMANALNTVLNNVKLTNIYGEVVSVSADEFGDGENQHKIALIESKTIAKENGEVMIYEAFLGYGNFDSNTKTFDKVNYGSVYVHCYDTIDSINLSKTLQSPTVGIVNNHWFGTVLGTNIEYNYSELDFYGYTESDLLQEDDEENPEVEKYIRIDTSLLPKDEDQNPIISGYVLYINGYQATNSQLCTVDGKLYIIIDSDVQDGCLITLSYVTSQEITNEDQTTDIVYTTTNYSFIYVDEKLDLTTVETNQNSIYRTRFTNFFDFLSYRTGIKKSNLLVELTYEDPNVPKSVVLTQLTDDYQLNIISTKNPVTFTLKVYISYVNTSGDEIKETVYQNTYTITYGS